jgi:hypothetical protein
MKPYLDLRGTPYVNLPLDGTNGLDKIEPVPLKSRPAQVYVRRKLVLVHPTKPVPEADLQHVLDVLEGHAVTAPRRKTPNISVVLDENLRPLMDVLEVIAKKGGIKAPSDRLLERVKNYAAEVNVPLSKLPKDKQELGNTLAKLAKGGMKARDVLISYDNSIKPREWHIRLMRDEQPTQKKLTDATDPDEARHPDTDGIPHDTGSTPPDTEGVETPVVAATEPPEGTTDEADTPEGDLTPGEAAELAQAEREINASKEQVKS